VFPVHRLYLTFLGSRVSRNIRPLPWWIVYG
jgi:hypothetical protein